jgi:hypothetical protein
MLYSLDVIEPSKMAKLLEPAVPVAKQIYLGSYVVVKRTVYVNVRYALHCISRTYHMFFLFLFFPMPILLYLPTIYLYYYFYLCLFLLCVARCLCTTATCTSSWRLRTATTVTWASSTCCGCCHTPPAHCHRISAAPPLPPVQVLVL